MYIKRKLEAKILKYLDEPDWKVTKPWRWKSREKPKLCRELQYLLSKRLTRTRKSFWCI